MVKQALALSRISLLLVTVYWLALFTATHTPLSVPPVGGCFTDKILHFTAYLLLAVLLGVFCFVTGRRTRGWMLAIFLGICVYGIVDELLQIPVGRSCEVADWIADVLGAATGLLCLWLVTTLAVLGQRPRCEENVG